MYGAQLYSVEAATRGTVNGAHKSVEDVSMFYGSRFQENKLERKRNLNSLDAALAAAGSKEKIHRQFDIYFRSRLNGASFSSAATLALAGDESGAVASEFIEPRDRFFGVQYTSTTDAATGNTTHIPEKLKFLTYRFRSSTRVGEGPLVQLATRKMWTAFAERYLNGKEYQLVSQVRNATAHRVTDTSIANEALKKSVGGGTGALDSKSLGPALLTSVSGEWNLSFFYESLFYESAFTLWMFLYFFVVFFCLYLVFFFNFALAIYAILVLFATITCITGSLSFVLGWQGFDVNATGSVSYLAFFTD